LSEVLRAGESDAKALVETLHAAFFDDPFSCYVFPEPQDRDRLHPRMMRSFVDLALWTGEIYTVSGYAAVAVWFPVPPREDDRDFLERTAELCGACGPRLRALAETMEHHHPASEPHHYLQFLATVPERQSQGLGGLLLRDRLRRLDTAGTPAYLEASSPRSAALYERAGFARMAPFAFPDGPAAIPMWRPAQGPSFVSGRDHDGL
jgi:GNAT superfamily N-acetyltransferase